MPYATRLDLEHRHGQAAVEQAAYRDALPVDQVIADALAGAGELIDAHCAARYLLPLNPLPGMVREICLDIAWWKLWRGAIPEEVAARYKEAMSQLVAIRDGKIILESAGLVAAPAVTTDSSVLLDEADRTFTRDTLKGW